MSIRFYSYIGVIGLFPLLISCAFLKRSESSGYYSEYQDTPPPLTNESKISEIEELARQELGFSESQPLTEVEQNQLLLRLALKRAENKLRSHKEKKQYYKLKPYMNTDRERLYFLSLPTQQARSRWAQSQNIGAEEEYPDHIAKIIEDNNIAVGMSRRAVKESWGDPDLVEVAGNPLYANERWKYVKLISSNDGYDKQIRIIYFEAGRVIGWESL